MHPNSPLQMSQIALKIATEKATNPFAKMMMLSIVAGVCISIAFAFCMTAMIGGVSYGATKVLGGFVFSLGLILCVVLGAELFTSSTLSAVPRASKVITTSQMLRHWSIAYLGNFIGAIIFVVLIAVAKTYLIGEGKWGLSVLKMAQYKLSHSFIQAVALGIMANLMVCVAVWLSYAGKTLTDKMLVMILPVTMFVACGFEHSIANMFLIPMAIVIHQFAEPEFWNQIGMAATTFEDVTAVNFIFNNLIPVTIGNIIGGAGFIGLTFWSIFLKKNTANSTLTQMKDEPASSQRIDSTI